MGISPLPPRSPSYLGKWTPASGRQPHPSIQNIPQKYPSKNYNKQHPTILYPFSYFLHIFTHFIKPQHNGRHVTTPSIAKPKHKGNPLKIGRADAEVNEVNRFFQI